MKNSELILQSFIAHTPMGSFDRAETMRRFEKAISSYVETTETMKPHILASVRSWNKLGEKTVIHFVLHSLQLPNIQSNIDKVKTALRELVKTGQLAITLNSAGGKRGRKAAYFCTA